MEKSNKKAFQQTSYFYLPCFTSNPPPRWPRVPSARFPRARHCAWPWSSTVPCFVPCSAGARICEYDPWRRRVELVPMSSGRPRSRLASRWPAGSPRPPRANQRGGARRDGRRGDAHSSSSFTVRAECGRGRRAIDGDEEHGAWAR
jgi:hypothetical protein